MSYEETEIGKMKVRGTEYPVHLSVTAGRDAVPSAVFTIPGLSTNKYGHDITHSTWEGLYNLAMVATKRATAKVSIPFLEEAHKELRSNKSPFRRTGFKRYFRSGTIVGRNVGNGNFLIQYDDLPNQKRPREYTTFDRSYGDDEGSHFFRPMGKERQAEYWKLVDEAQRANEALSKFRNAMCFDPTNEVESAVEKALSDEEREIGKGKKG